MPNVPPPPISARMTATGGKHRPEKPLRKLRQLAKSSREDQPCRSLRKLPVNQSHESPSPEQVKALALRMAEQRAQAENPTQDTKRPAPSGDEPLDLSEPEDWGEASPFESRQAPRTKADLLNEIRQRTDRLTGQREAEQRQIDPWQAQPPQRRGHGR